MTFVSIALKNARKKFGSYLAYFVSTAFSVVIFNLFCSLYYNPTFEAFRFGTGKMSTLFRASAVVVLVFAAVFVLYSGSYFLKTQKREIAIYSLLGMRKRTIALVMFLETFAIGIAAVVLGTLVGTLSTGLFTSLLMRFMAIGTSVSMVVEPKAALITFAAFAVLFVISGIRAYRTIYRYTLMDLLSAAQRTEGMPKYSVWGALISIVLVVAGYVVSARMNLNEVGPQLLVPAFAVLLFVAIGTFLLFRNFVPMAVAAFKRNKTLYYRTTSFIGISQIAFRLKANSGILAVTAMLVAVTVTMVSASYSLYNGLEDGTDYYAPYSYLAKDVSDELHAEMLDTVARVGEVEVVADDMVELLDVRMANADYALDPRDGEEAVFGQMNDTYLLSESTYETIIADTMPADSQSGEGTNLGTGFQGGLGAGECFFLDGNPTAVYSAGLPGQDVDVAFHGETTALSVVGTALHKYIGLLDTYRHPTLVVSDATYAAYRLQADDGDVETYRGLMFDDEMASGATVDALDTLIPARFSGGGLPPNVSYIGIYKANFALYGSYVFIGLFIGILFLLATGSVLYYKMIIEAQEEVPRFGILRKSGLKEGEARVSTAKQLGLVFGLPFICGLCHTTCALLLYNRMLDLMGQETPTLANAALVVLVFVVVYGIFYALSVRSCHRIVWGR